MKDSLFEMLLNLFEKTLTQLKENHASVNPNDDSRDSEEDGAHAFHADPDFSVIKAATTNSIRIFTSDEQIKLTKASYQFLMRMASWGIIEQETLELIINQLIISSSRFVTLQETKWTIRNVLATSLDAEQLVFLDLVLYHKEDKLQLH